MYVPNHHETRMADEQEIEDPFYLTANKMFGTCHSSSASTNKVLQVTRSRRHRMELICQIRIAEWGIQDLPISCLAWINQDKCAL
jgi:hypothetical protein